MFSTFKQKLLLGVFVFLILSIPVGAYLASQRQNPNISAKQEDKPPVTKLRESTQSAQSLLGEKPTTTTPTPKPSSSTPATSFGPTMELKLILEGRPLKKMASKIFIGIADAASKTNLKYLLSFNIDLPDSGEFKGISLAGLTAGTSYQAVIKGPAQIATSSAFVMAATTTNLNSNQPITLITGDLNEDNTINSADYSIAKKAFGSSSGDPNWNDNVDFNKDGIINSADIAIILRNMAKIGDSGLWVSQIPASGSAILNTESPISSASGATESPRPGYWLWVPGL